MTGTLVALGDDLAEWQVPPVEVDRPPDRAGPAVDEARRPDPDPEERRRSAVEEPVEEVEDELRPRRRRHGRRPGARRFDGSRRGD